MSVYHCENTPGDIEACGIDEVSNGREMDSIDVEKADGEFHLANDTIELSPRSAQSEICSPKRNERQRPKSSRASIIRPMPPLSSIPLPVKAGVPNKTPLKNAKSISRPSTVVARPTSIANKHTLEIQFLNKNKRYILMKKELVEKQKPIIDLYQNLMQIKKRLETLGKNVKLEEIKLIPVENYKVPANNMGAGEQVSIEVVNSMKNSIEEIPKTLMDICKNLLSRRALIVELLESVTKAEVDVTDVSDKIESLKSEGQQLQQSLDAVIQEHESKICELVNNWQKLLNDKQNFNTDTRIEELEGKLKEEERLKEESALIIHDLHRKLEERRHCYDKSIAELNGVLQSLREQVKKLEQDLDNERKATVDIKSRNSSNAQNLKTMRAKITELENEKKEIETSNAELQRKVKFMQDQLKHKESQWTKEKDDMSRSLKHQEHLLQKLTADKNLFETRIESIEKDKDSNEEQLKTAIASLTDKLETTRIELNRITVEKDEALEKCSGFENYIARMGANFKETMNRVTCSVDWGNADRDLALPQAENYMQDVAKDLRIRELEDKIIALQNETSNQEKLEIIKQENTPNQIEMELSIQQGRVQSYQILLEDSENKLREKLCNLRTAEVENLRAEIIQLKVRQEAIEEQNELCSARDMKRTLEEGREKLKELTNRVVESESRIEEYMSIIEKQKIQMTEMDNLLRYRENMANVLKASRNELLLEKESLSRYSREARNALVEISSQCSMKDQVIKNLNEKVTAREIQLKNLEKNIQDLEDNLKSTNAKRYKLQDTVGKLEKELQRIHLKSSRIPSKACSFLDSVYEVEDKPNKKNAHYCNSFMEKSSENDLTSPCATYSRCLRKKYNELETIQRDYFNPNSLNSTECSSKKLLSEGTSSIHTHCHHKANSRSLISLSLQTVDFIKTKLNFLTSVNVSETSSNHLQDVNDKQTRSTPPTQRTNHLNKILELTAHRHEYLQNQAQESYDDLADLVKLAVIEKRAVRK